MGLAATNAAWLVVAQEHGEELAAWCIIEDAHDLRRVRLERERRNFTDPIGEDAAHEDVVLVTGVTRLAEGELENDLDDDGNGRTDEAGFNLQRSGDVISVLLCLGRARSGGAPVTRTMTASVRLRN